MEQVNSPIKGTYRDIVRGPDGAVIYDSGWQSNKIVDSCHTLLAALVKGESAKLLLKIGSGDNTWEGGNPPEPPNAATDLVTPYEQPPLDKLETSYLETSGAATNTPKNRMQIKATLGPDYPSDANYPLREFGLFGMVGSTPYMINCVRHPTIRKGQNATLVRTIFLEF